jgi:hypothetical protein
MADSKKDASIARTVRVLSAFTPCWVFPDQQSAEKKLGVEYDIWKDAILLLANTPTFEAWQKKTAEMTKTAFGKGRYDPRFDDVVVIHGADPNSPDFEVADHVRTT